MVAGYRLPKEPDDGWNRRALWSGCQVPGHVGGPVRRPWNKVRCITWPHRQRIRPEVALMVRNWGGLPPLNLNSHLSTELPGAGGPSLLPRGPGSGESLEERGPERVEGSSLEGVGSSGPVSCRSTVGGQLPLQGTVPPPGREAALTACAFQPRTCRRRSPPVVMG